MSNAKKLTDETVGILRDIRVSESSIQLLTGAVPDATYAYYLTHKNGVEKQFYSSDTSTHFVLPRLPGFYVATFFYALGDVKCSHKVIFVVNKENCVTIVRKTEVAQSQEFKIDYYDRGADTTFIVFNGYGSTLKSTPFGLHFLIAQGFNVVACLHNNNQYQGLSLEQFEGYIKPLIHGKRVFLYGSSLGAYCAIYYAGVVNGNVIAAAPRNSAHPDMIRLNGATSKYKPENFKHNNIINNQITSGRIYVLIDPNEKLDMIFLNHFILTAYPNAEIIEFPYAGHEVLFHVNETGQLKKILSQIVSGEQHISVDSNLHSKYSDIGRARHFCTAANYEEAKFYAQRALAVGVPVKSVEAELRKLITMADVQTSSNDTPA
ncbi:hypothetical protein [Alcaligenes faecalis]|uniref:Alpha/beta hydrolase n=1 Tax=Alcaligenes faecalis TaxID=511 RepID=A0AB33CYB8_ALCFA|nr:hypothetical protein [Alcaligenes faecalis]ASR88862.1 hypothetical protein AFA_05015 [Alcaligenes faecalis]